jgi:hypothetical protein
VEIHGGKRKNVRNVKGNWKARYSEKFQGNFWPSVVTDPAQSHLLTKDFTNMYTKNFGILTENSPISSIFFIKFFNLSHIGIKALKFTPKTKAAHYISRYIAK